MKKFFGAVGIIVVLAIAGLLIYASTMPATYKIERSVLIKAPAASVYPLIVDLHNWTTWSPWEKMDPAMQRTFTGAEKGKGAVYSWSGKRAGDGAMEITEATEPSDIKVRDDWFKPMKATNTSEFTLVPDGDSTKVSWIMTGDNGYMAKVVHVFISMDKVLGAAFDDGLSKLKAQAEAMPATNAKKAVKKK
jgi:uncharacterized protein YndB with AHSA1/START domain